MRAYAEARGRRIAGRVAQRRAD